ncbi:MAG: hypothetical protein WKG07_13835 [Hymenobacter sp.]
MTATATSSLTATGAPPALPTPPRAAPREDNIFNFAVGLSRDANHAINYRVSRRYRPGEVSGVQQWLDVAQQVGRPGSARLAVRAPLARPGGSTPTGRGRSHRALRGVGSFRATRIGLIKTGWCRRWAIPFARPTTLMSTPSPCKAPTRAAPLRPQLRLPAGPHAHRRAARLAAE